MKNFKRKVGRKPAPWTGFLNIPTTEDVFDDVENMNMLYEYILNH